MAGRIKQLCYPGDALNFNENNWSNNLISGSITQLNIYAFPGTRFCVNQEDRNTVKDLIIGGYGVLSFNLEENPITSLLLHKDSYDIASNNNHFIIIDMIEEGGAE